jgi:hypothetical protein
MLFEEHYVYKIWDKEAREYAGAKLSLGNQLGGRIWSRYGDAVRTLKGQHADMDRYEIHRFYLTRETLPFKEDGVKKKKPQPPRKPGRLRPYGPRRNTFKGEQA